MSKLLYMKLFELAVLHNRHAAFLAGDVIDEHA
jgi:hypothetical protein